MVQQIAFVVPVRHHPVGEIVHALKITSLHHHDFSRGKQPLQMTLMRFPLPPAAGAFTRMFEIGRTHRAVVLNMRNQLVDFVGIFMHPFLPILPAHVLRREHPMPHQPEIGTRQKTGFMRPVFHQIAPA
ncbi:hypothetical protein D3C81_1588570 [compost metagenome]